MTALKKILFWNWLQQSWMGVNMQNTSVSYEFDVNLNMKVLYSKVSHFNSLSCVIFFEYLIKKKI